MYHERNLLSSLARSATGSGAVVDTLEGDIFGPYAPSARAYLNVSAVAGAAPTLNVTILGVVNGVEVQLGAFAQASAVGKQTIQLPDCARHVRADYTIGGTAPSFTFSVELSR